MEQRERKRLFADEKEKKEKQKEIMAIKDRAERIRAIARNKELFR